MDDPIFPDSHPPTLRARIADLESKLDAYRAALIECVGQIEHNSRGSTHWVGCESSHPCCAALRQAREALSVDELPLPSPDDAIGQRMQSGESCLSDMRQGLRDVERRGTDECDALFVAADLLPQRCNLPAGHEGPHGRA